jgi:acyl-CoA thioesterase FadM
LFLQKKFLFLTDVYSAHVELDFKSSAVLGDVLICRARMCDVNLAGKTFLIEFEARKKDSVLVSVGNCVCAFQSPNGRAMILKEVPKFPDLTEQTKRKRLKFSMSKL